MYRVASQSSLSKAFTLKRSVPLLSVRKSCPLSFHERMIYSYLHHRERAATQKRISRHLRISARAVKDALSELNSYGLTERSGGKWLPKAPNADWFLRNSKCWNYHTHYLLKSGEWRITWTENAVLWQLHKLAELGRSSTISGLTGLLGFSRNTVRTSLAMLHELQIVKLSADAITLLDIERWAKCWQDKNQTAKVENPFKDLNVPAVLPQYKYWERHLEELDDFATELRNEGLSAVQIKTFLSTLMKKLLESTDSNATQFLDRLFQVCHGGGLLNLREQIAKARAKGYVGPPKLQIKQWLAKV